MSFDPNPALWSYSTAPDICNACFDANKSPTSVFIELTGIEIGAAWIAADGPPPNGVFELPVTAPCEWGVTIAPWIYALDYTGGNSRFIIETALAVSAFIANSAVGCLIWQPNSLVNPALKFFNGQALITPPLEGGVFSSEQLLEWIGYDVNLDTLITPSAQESSIGSYKLTRRADHTNIIIQYDHS